MDLLTKVLIALVFGLIFGYLFRVFSKRRLGTPFELAQRKQIKVDNVMISYLQAGHGPDLVLVHGIASSVFCWRFVFKRLTTNFRVTALDLPGFGASEKDPNLGYDLDSQADRVARFLQALNIHSCHLMGASMGGAISLWLGRKYPDLIGKIVTISPAAHRGIVFLDPKPLLGFVKMVGPRVVSPYIVEKAYRRTVSTPNLVTQQAINEYYRPFAESKNTAVCFWKAHDTLRDPRLPEALQELKKETLVIYGERDRLVKRRFTDSILQNLRQGKLVLHPTAGHHLMEDEPDFLIETVNEFLLSTKALT